MSQFMTARVTPSGSTPTLLVSWVRAGHPFKVLVANTSTTTDLYVTNSSAVGAADAYILGMGSELQIEVPAADRGSTPAAEDLYVFTQPGQSAIVVALVQPA